MDTDRIKRNHCQRSYEPSAVLRQLLSGFGVEEHMLGSQYLACGTRPTAQ